MLYTALAAPNKDHWSFFMRTGLMRMLTLDFIKVVRSINLGRLSMQEAMRALKHWIACKVLGSKR